MHMTLSVQRDVDGGKPYIARITGTDKTFGLAREFLASRAEYSKRGRSGEIRATVAERGIYELCSISGGNKRSVFWLVTEHEVEFIRIQLKESSVYEIFASGRDLSSLRVRKKEDGTYTSRRAEDNKLDWMGDDESKRAQTIAHIQSLMSLHGISAEDLK